MITYQRESFKQIFGESFLQLIKDNWEETGIFKSSFILNPQWDMYKTLENNGILYVYTARRSDNNLVGYYFGIRVEHNYYQDVLVIETDVFFIHIKYRVGLTGYKFLKYIIEDLKNEADIIMIPTTIQRDLSSILNRLGFELVEYKFALEV